jgi:peptidoglycan/LPS O-acetylase OafA/YrhL
LSALKYRPDIDCLRAFSVLAVVCFHFDISPIRSGYVGVDVFFVISGYLITGIIYAESKAGRFSFRNFYARRARRILPALLVTVFATIGFAYLVLPPSQYVDLANQALAAIGSSSNIWFWSQQNYFDGTALTKPLLQTWSLGVEEQFYILFPLVLAFALRRTARLAYWIAGVGLISFLFCIYQSATSPAAAFYLLPSRAWEFGLGALLAVDALPAVPHRHKLWLAVLGWCALAASANLFGTGVPYPSFRAALPCLGAALVIWSHVDVPLNRFTRPILFIGLISYSLYLWHWPVAVFSYELLGAFQPPQVKALLLLVCLLLAIASYLWVETPFRRPGQGAMAMIAAAATAVVVACIPIRLTSGAPGRFSPEEAAVGRFSAYDHAALYDEGRCFVQRDQVFSRDACITPVAGKRNVLVWGDSYAAHLVHGLRQAADGVAVMQATRAGCAAIGELLTGEGCRAFNKDVLDAIMSVRPDVVLLSANWISGIYARGAPTELPALIARLRNAGVAVVVVGPTAALDGPLPSLFVTWSRLKNLLPPLSTRVLPVLWEADAKLQAISNASGARYVSPLQAMCPDRACELFVDGTPIMWDAGHLTAEGSARVGSIIVARAALLNGGRGE